MEELQRIPAKIPFRVPLPPEDLELILGNAIIPQEYV